MPVLCLLGLDLLLLCWLLSCGFNFSVNLLFCLFLLSKLASVPLFLFYVTVNIVNSVFSYYEGCRDWVPVFFIVNNVFSCFALVRDSGKNAVICFFFLYIYYLEFLGIVSATFLFVVLALPNPEEIAF